MTRCAWSPSLWSAVFALVVASASAQTSCSASNGANAQTFSLSLDVSCTPAGQYKCNWTTSGSPAVVATYCVSAHPLCYHSGSYCPMYINTENWNLADRVIGTPMIWVDVANANWNSQCIGECNAVKHILAALPRVIAAKFPGLDKTRVWLLGFGAGGGGIVRTVCDTSKGYDRSPFGDTSDIYAGMAFMGGCFGCPSIYGQGGELIGNMHYYSANGVLDSLVGASGCIDQLQRFAVLNGCSAPTNTWCNVQAGDPYFPGTQADGSANAQRVAFGPCQGGDVLGYLFPNLAHFVNTPSGGFYNPRIGMKDMFWAWQAGRSKTLSNQVAPTANTCSATTPSATPNPNNWQYSRNATYPNGFNPISYWKATGDPFAWPNPQFVATEVATTPDPVIPPLQATVQVIGWSGFPPISAAAQSTLLGALANATGLPTSTFTIALQVPFGPRVSVSVIINGANSDTVLQAVLNNATAIRAATGAVSVTSAGDFTSAPLGTLPPATSTLTTTAASVSATSAASATTVASTSAAASTVAVTSTAFAAGGASGTTTAATSTSSNAVTTTALSAASQTSTAAVTSTAFATGGPTATATAASTTTVATAGSGAAAGSAQTSGGGGGSGGLSGGAIAGIVIGVLVLVALGATAFYFLVLKKASGGTSAAPNAQPAMAAKSADKYNLTV